MSDSLRYKIVLWLVWVQIALLPIWVCMVYFCPYSYAWRWGLDAWVFIAAFLLGLFLLPLSRDLELPNVLKWWLRIDFSFTLILAFPVLAIAYEYIPDTIAEQDEFIVYHVDGIVANRNAYLARKKGLFLEKIADLHPYEGGRLPEKNYRFDKQRGYFYGHAEYSPRSNGSRTWVVPIDSVKYTQNQQYIFSLIDNVFHSHGKWFDNDEMTFTLPDDLSQMDCKERFISMDMLNGVRVNFDYGWSDIVEIVFYKINVDTAFSPDMEVEYSYPDTTYKLPPDSVPWMSPSETRRFINKYIRQQKGGKQ